jgi:hypothetical protein
MTLSDWRFGWLFGTAFSFAIALPNTSSANRDFVPRRKYKSELKKVRRDPGVLRRL